MSQATVMSPAAIQQLIAPMFPGLLGVELVETTPDERRRTAARAAGGLPPPAASCTAAR